MNGTDVRAWYGPSPKLIVTAAAAAAADRSRVARAHHFNDLVVGVVGMMRKIHQH
jgi:hypothetical protein